MSGQATTGATTTYDLYAGNPGENYERYFVPSIGAPSAKPMVDVARLRQGERVLDVGCGTGVATRMAAEAVGSAGTVVGVDGHPVMLVAARAATPPGMTIDWQQAPAERLPLTDGSFDAVLCSLAYQFFGDKAAALAEMRRVLAGGGRAVLATPGPTPPAMQVVDDILGAHIGPQASAFVQTVFSVHDPDEVRGELEHAGFDGVEVATSTLTFHLPPPADFFWQYVTSTPLAEAAGRLDPAVRAAMERDVVERCEPLLTGGELVMDTGLLVASGHRGI